MTSKDSSVTLYAAAGETLHHYAVDVERATLERRGAVALPAGMQYAWRHPRLPLLYCACSNGSPGVLGDTHFVIALDIANDGSLKPHGAPVPLPARPIHITLDVPGEHALIAYNDPSGVTVHRLDAAGAVSAALPQPSAIDVGVFAHQIRVMPSNRTVVLVTRGNDARADRAEDPGALKVFDYHAGELANRASIAPNGGYGFGPRHVDFHPAKPWVYVSLERQNALQVYYAPDDAFEERPRFDVPTLAEAANVRPEQRAGTLHVHPRGHVVYVANRANAKNVERTPNGYSGGESNIAVFALDETTGKPRAIQHADTRGFVPRTFSIDPTGRLMVVANSETRAGVSPNLCVFSIADDGRLSHVANHDVDTGGKTLFWSALLEANFVNLSQGTSGF